MNNFSGKLINGIEIFFVIYLLIYCSYLFLALITGAWNLYRSNRMDMLHNELKHKYYVPVSILVPAFNEEVTILKSIKSLLDLDYQLYEIIVINDGSTDKTAEKIIDFYNLQLVKRPIKMLLKCKAYKNIYESSIDGVKITLISKLNGGKGDALNMGINASRFPYFLTVDADSILQRDSVENIVQPVIRDENIIAVGGLISVAQSTNLQDGKPKEHYLPWNPIISMQIVEYYRSFLTSKILMNKFNGNLIISGAFGLFKKSIALGAGGYDTDTLGEDMEIVLKLHTYCRNNDKKYSIHYEPRAICWSQVPSTLKDLITQRRRWYLGLFQCMSKYHNIFLNSRFGLLSVISYMYYLFFELLSPAIEVLGIFIIFLSAIFGILDFGFMVRFFLLYSVYGIFLTMTAFYQRVYTEDHKNNFMDTVKAIIMSLMEGLFLKYILAFVRITSFIGYKNKRLVWGTVKRVENKEIS